jgi:transcriptional regulator with XRE-family HTH domain
MNFTQMHERLRTELLRRIRRGTLSVSLLARQTGYGQSHLSNFLRNKRQLSLEAMDRILAAQQLAAADLLPSHHQSHEVRDASELSTVPVVSHSVALFEPNIRPAAVQSLLHLPARALGSVRARASTGRRAWQRFVAVRIPPSDAPPMDPLLLPGALAVIDRHYNSLAPYRSDRPNLYAVRLRAHLAVRYEDFLAQRLVLRPHNIAFPVELLELEPDGSPNDLITGRIVLILNEP